MAHIYITEKTKGLLDEIIESETTTISKVIEKFASERAKELGIPAVQEQDAPVVESPSSVEGTEHNT